MLRNSLYPGWFLRVAGGAVFREEVYSSLEEGGQGYGLEDGGGVAEEKAGIGEDRLDEARFQERLTNGGSLHAEEAKNVRAARRRGGEG